MVSYQMIIKSWPVDGGEMPRFFGANKHEVVTRPGKRLHSEMENHHF